MINLSLLLAWVLTDIVATYGVLHYRRGLDQRTPLLQTPKVACCWSGFSRRDDKM